MSTAATPSTISFNHAHDLPRVEEQIVPGLRVRLAEIVGRENILTQRAELAVYECDGFTIDKNIPDVVVFPNSTAHVVEIVKACNQFKVPFVARGAGTSLAGGCVPVGGGVMIGMMCSRK